MPYIIYVPGIPQPYITNDPRIYMDCLKASEWKCESRPFNDEFCKAFQQEEGEQFQSDWRRGQLEAYWVEELERRTKPKEGTTSPGENKTLSTAVTVEKLAEHSMDEIVLAEIKDRKEGAL